MSYRYRLRRSRVQYNYPESLLVEHGTKPAVNSFSLPTAKVKRHEQNRLLGRLRYMWEFRPPTGETSAMPLAWPAMK